MPIYLLQKVKVKSLTWLGQTYLIVRFTKCHIWNKRNPFLLPSIAYTLTSNIPEIPRPCQPSVIALQLFTVFESLGSDQCTALFQYSREIKCTILKVTASVFRMTSVHENGIKYYLIQF